MKTSSLILVGAGGHARSCIDVIEREGHYDILGLIAIPSEVGQEALGYPVLGVDADMPKLLVNGVKAIVAVGQIKTAEIRIRLFRLLEQYDCEVPTIISPHAYVSPHATLGAGTIIMHGAVVNAGASVGRNCIVNSQALIEHDTKVADHCHVSTAAAVNSGVRIGEGSFIGSNTSVRQGARIGAHCIIGMGQRVLNDCPDDSQLPAARTE